MSEQGAPSEDEFWQQFRDAKKPAVPTAELAEAMEAPVSDEYQAVRKELWQSAGWFTLWAIVNLLSGNVPFALSLFVLALLTYLRPFVAMFAVQGLFFLWGAAINLLNSPDGTGIFWAIVLIVSCFVELRRFFRHRRLAEEPVGRHLLPWLALGGGVAGLLGWLVMWLLLLAWGTANDWAGDPPALILTPLWLSAHIGALGLVSGMASLLTHLPYKGASAGGIACGGLLVLIVILFLLVF
jgi:AcrR family transcriptional regulator